MNSLEQIDGFYIKMCVLAVFALGHFIVGRKNNLKLTLQYLLYSYGIMILLLCTSNPNVFPGYPDTFSDLENKKMLLYHLHKNNEALSQLIEVVREMAFITFLILVSVVSKIIKYFKLDQSVE